MKKIILPMLFFAIITKMISCSNNHAAEQPEIRNQTEKKVSGSFDEDGPSIGKIETEQYILKLHRAFAYEPKGSELLAGMKPKEGFKFIYLDVSLKNKSSVKPDGGFLFIGLKVTDDQGQEYKKPAAALAAYHTEHPAENNDEEYKELWENFEQDEFHRSIVYAVEVPEGINTFILHMPEATRAKKFRQLKFSL